MCCIDQSKLPLFAAIHLAMHQGTVWAVGVDQLKPRPLSAPSGLLDTRPRWCVKVADNRQLMALQRVGRDTYGRDQVVCLINANNEA